MKRLPPLWLSCVPLALLVALIACVVSIFGDETLAGASQLALLVATASCVSIGIVTNLISWNDFERAVSDKVGGVSSAIIILLLIGALGGAWMVSGVVPTIIYYGMEIMSPKWFLVSACLICSLVSVLTGSSWTTIATIGVALMGIGKALGFSEAWIAGAVISGAYFGDKMSPMSDTTVLASSTVGTPLFTHIRYMLYTTVPTYFITLTIFTVVGLGQGEMVTSHVATVQHGLQQTFIISPWLILVPVLTFVLILMRLPSMVVLFLATLLGVVAAVLCQTHLLDQVAGITHEGIAQRIRGAFIIVYGSTDLDTGMPELNDLVATKGMAGMLNTIWIILCAMAFGAAMTATRMLESIMQALLRLVRGTVSLVASTAFSGMFLNIVSADQYLSIILTATMFGDTYKKNGYESRLLSRTCEDSATVTSVLIPWNTCGMTQASVLGVSTLVYAPYCFFCYLSPIVTILVAAFLPKKNFSE
ncbi:MAG: Na+/H+ antiporter NhaC [Bacteroidaceae bacterium]|nr:Na+/H+ antiporter NhaC [Bacteroidaceae bacterium]